MLDPQIEPAAQGVPGVQAACADAPPRLLDLRSLKEVTLAETLPRLAGADLVLVGESHGTAAHHRAQLAVIRALHESGEPVRHSQVAEIFIKDKAGGYRPSNTSLN